MIADLLTKRIFSAIIVANISKSFTYNMTSKINWHGCVTIITSLSPYVFGFRMVFLKISLLDHCRK